MKNKKILGLSIATIGAIVATGTSFALYSKVDNPINGNITIKLPDAASGEIQYTIGEIIEPIDKIRPNNATVKYTVPLSATLPQTYTNEIVPGNLKVDLKTEDKTNYSISCKLIGYGEGSYGEHAYSGISDFSKGENIYVKAAETQKLEITVTLTNTDDTNFMNNLAGKPYNIDVTWAAEKDNKELAWVVGDRSGWECRDEYKMVKDIDKAYNDNIEGEWLLKGVKGFGQYKVRVESEKYTSVNTPNPRGEMWFGEGNDPKSSSSANITIDRTKTYDFRLDPRDGDNSDGCNGKGHAPYATEAQL